MVKESLGGLGSSDVGDWLELAGVASSWERYSADAGVNAADANSLCKQGPHWAGGRLALGEVGDVAGRGEGRGAGCVLDASLHEDDGRSCGPRVLSGLLDLVQHLHVADREDQALQQWPQLVRGPHALVGEGRRAGDRG